MAALYDKQRLSDLIAAWLLARAGIQPLPGPPTCRDSCVLDRTRWQLNNSPDGPFYTCRKCGRFVGFLPREKERR